VYTAIDFRFAIADCRFSLIRGCHHPANPIIFAVVGIEGLVRVKLYRQQQAAEKTCVKIPKYKSVSTQFTGFKF